MKHILIIEPNSRLKEPYEVLSLLLRGKATFSRVENFMDGEQKLLDLNPDMVLISCSFPAEEQHRFLELFSSQFITRIVPLVFVIDWSCPFPQLIGTTWGKQIGVIHTLSSSLELQATLKKTFYEEKYW